MRFKSVILIAVFAATAHAKNSGEASVAQMMETLAGGPPVLSQTVLDPAAYVQEEVQRLTGARVAYVNWRALDEIFTKLGYSNAPRTMTPEFQKAILDQLAYAKKMPGEPESAYEAKTKKYHSIRYGGHFLNYNFGSGRNGAAGMVDVKGIGKTSLVRPWSDGGHGNGVCTLGEALKEVVWSNLLNEELPLGANRVLFIIATGTRSVPHEAASEERALIVREDMLRPAYFQQNLSVNSDQMSEELRKFHTPADAVRMKKLLPKFQQALPKPKIANPNWTKAQALRAGFIEMIDRVSMQYASAHVRQLLLAGTSTSNVQIDGTALDYGATTAVLGFTKIRYIGNEAENGSAESLKSDLFFELAGDIRQVIPKNLAAGIPSDEEIAARVDEQYRANLERGFLELAGVPKEFSFQLIATPEGKSLSQTIMRIAYAGNEEVRLWSEDYGTKPTGTYDLEKVMTALMTAPGRLPEVLPDTDLRERLRGDLAKAFARLAVMARAEGISAGNLRKYMALAAPARLRPVRGMNSNVFWNSVGKISRQFAAGNPESMQEFADRRFEQDTREFKDGRFELVLKAKKNLATGFWTRSVFNLKTGEMREMSEPRPSLTCEPQLTAAG